MPHKALNWYQKPWLNSIIITIINYASSDKISEKYVANFMIKIYDQIWPNMIWLVDFHIVWSTVPTYCPYFIHHCVYRMSLISSILSSWLIFPAHTYILILIFIIIFTYFIYSYFYHHHHNLYHHQNNDDDGDDNSCDYEDEDDNSCDYKDEDEDDYMCAGYINHEDNIADAADEIKDILRTRWWIK